jgi:hypothetical protein
MFFVNKLAQLSFPTANLVRPTSEKNLLEMVTIIEQQWYIEIQIFPLILITIVYQ